MRPYPRGVEEQQATAGLGRRQQCATRGKNSRGFTLVELMMVIAIISILAAVALAVYFSYIVRGHAAQTLSSYDHIRTVVHVETQADGRTDLQLDSVPGEAPPALEGMLGSTDFNQPYGTMLQLVKAPAGTFASFPNTDTYALIASADDRPGEYFLRELRAVLPHAEGDKLWLTSDMLYFPLDTGTGTASGAAASPGETGAGSSETSPASPETPSPPAPPASGWSTPETTNKGSTWDAQANVCLSGTDGNLLSSDLNAQVRVRIVQEVRTWDGQTTERSWETQVPIVNGCATVSQTGSPYATQGNEGVTGLRFEIIGVNYYWPTDPPVKWDGNTPSLHISAPT